MKNKLSAFVHSEIFIEFSLGLVLILAFSILGYFAREFAIDLQTNFLFGIN